MSIPDVRADEPVIELAWATEDIDPTGMEPEDRARRCSLTRHVTQVVDRNGNTRTHGVYEFDGRYWIEQGQAFPDDGTGFADVESAKAKVAAFYQAESNEIGWQKFRRETVPTPEVLEAMASVADAEMRTAT